MGKYRCILDKFYKKIIAVIFWEIIKRYFAQKIDEYRRNIWLYARNKLEKEGFYL